MRVPKFIDIELNTDCNLHCSFCPYHKTHVNPTPPMKFTLFQKIIEEVKEWSTLPSLKLCQRGEPLLSKDLLKAIEYAGKYDLSTCINTNGLLLPEFATQLATSSLTTLYLSDYGIPLQYRNAIYFKATMNIFKSKVDFTVKTPTPKKWTGITNHIIIPTMYDYQDLHLDLTPLPKWKCPELYNKLIIEPNGDVRECCGNIHKEKYLGNINNNTLKEILFSEPHTSYYVLHNKGLSHMIEMCAMCPTRHQIVKDKEK